MSDVAFSTPHITVLALTAGTAYVMSIAGRRANPPGRKLRITELTLAGILLLIYPIELYYKMERGYPLKDCLPLHLCDLASYIGAYALITRRPLPSELIYFWGLAGTLQALVTPASLGTPFPSIPFFLYFAHHSTIVITAIFVVAGRRDFPRPKAVIRMMLWTQVYAISIGTINFILGSNYAFLREKPSASASLMDLLGPWPWYILSMQLVALIFFTLLYLPFYPHNRRLVKNKLGANQE